MNARQRRGERRWERRMKAEHRRERDGGPGHPPDFVVPENWTEQLAEIERPWWMPKEVQRGQ